METGGRDCCSHNPIYLTIRKLRFTLNLIGAEKKKEAYRREAKNKGFTLWIEPLV
jgi:hypothetical protein